MNYDKKKILSMLKNIPLYKGIDFYEEDNDDILSALKNLEDDFVYANGASKLVFIPIDEDQDFVIKIPYTGSYYMEYTIDGGESKHYYRYSFAEDKRRPWDYCLAEVARYKLAISHGLGRCLARTEYIGSVNGYPIYVQEKCDVLSHTNTITHTEKAHSITLKASGVADFDGFIDMDWLTDFRLYYGRNMLNHFAKFIVDHGWEDDLRRDNIGYIDDRPVLIDYSSFLD